MVGFFIFIFSKWSNHLFFLHKITCYSLFIFTVIFQTKKKFSEMPLQQWVASYRAVTPLKEKLI